MHEEEEKLILQKIPLQKKLAKISCDTFRICFRFMNTWRNLYIYIYMCVFFFCGSGKSRLKADKQ